MASSQRNLRSTAAVSATEDDSNSGSRTPSIAAGSEGARDPLRRTAVSMIEDEGNEGGNVEVSFFRFRGARSLPH